MEYLEENLEDWLSGELEGYGDDDYLVFDCPGQVTATTDRPLGKQPLTATLQQSTVVSPAWQRLIDRVSHLP